MKYVVRLISGRSAEFEDLELARASAQRQAAAGFQAAVLQIDAEGGETLLITYLKKIPLPEPEQGQEPPRRGQGPMDFVFIYPNPR